MKLDPGHAQQARQVADAVLYEGYLLYPYHKSAQKNQVRFQFGVLMPPAYAAIDSSEPSASQTECLLECPDSAELAVLVRFLQVQRRIVQQISPQTCQPHDVDVLAVDGAEYASWDEAAEREQPVAVPVADLLAGDRDLQCHIGAGEFAEDIRDSAGRTAGRIIRRWNGLDLVIGLRLTRLDGPYGALRLRLRVENHTTPGAVLRTRDDGLRRALVATHALIGVPGGRFVSMTDPPEWAAPEVAACENIGTWPVLAGPPDCRDLVLSSPVILYDHPEIAGESAGSLFDATEIDEILTLRTLALTEAEKREARLTDPLAAELMDRVDGLPPEMFERMHGAIRYLGPTPGGPAAAAGLGQGLGVALTASGSPAGPGAAASQADPGMSGSPAGPGRLASPGGPGMFASPAGPGTPASPAGPGTLASPAGPGAAADSAGPLVPWWDPGSDTSVSPETDHVNVAGVRVARGARVRMRPGARRADAQDLFLAGRTAVVEAVLHDVDGQVHLAVTPDDDPDADLQRSHGRFLYFAPDEVEPLAEPAAPGDRIPAGEDSKRPGGEERS